MSVRRSFDQALTDWLDDGPVAAPREDLAALLEAFPEVRQRRRIGWETLPMPILVRLAIAAAIVALVGGLAITRLSPSIVGPAATPAPTPGWADRFPIETAARFVIPFRYALDPSTGLVLKGTPDPTIHQFGVPDPANPDTYPTGVVVQIVREVRLVPCTSQGGPTLMPSSPRAFVDYVATLPGLVVSKPVGTTVDGRPALQIDITQPADRPCKDLWVWWGEDFPFTQTTGDGWSKRFLVFDVDGRMVLVVIYASDGRMQGWLPTADAFVDSLHFLETGTSPAPSR